VGLIEDEDLEAVSSWGKDCSLAKIAGIVDSVVAGSIDFDYVE
jgi:hypothetical protein